MCFNIALTEDYEELSPAEGNLETPSPPFLLERAAQMRLHTPQPGDEPNDADEDGRPLGGGAVREILPTMSVHSPPVLVFFQSLMPWNELDESGVRVEPYFWVDVGRGMGGAAQGSVFFFVGIACDLVRLASAATVRFFDSLRAITRGS